MSPDRAPRRPTALLRAVLVAGAVAVSTTVPVTAAAAADEPGGTPVVGRLVQAWAERGPDEHDHDHEAAAPLSWVETEDGAVRVPTEDLSGVPVGATVELTVGGDVRDEGAVEHGLAPAQEVLATGSVTPPAAVAPVRAPVTNQVTVVLVAPAGTQPDAGVAVQDVVTPLAGAVSDFWSEQTGGAVRFGVAGTHDWIRTTAGCADPTALWDEAAAAVGFEAGPGRHLLLYLSSGTAAQAGCSYALAEVGAGPSSGGRLYVRDALPSIIAHELGHNLGLAHSSGLQCDGTLEAGECRTSGYRDLYDVMGASWRQLGSLSAPQAALLGVLPAGATLDLGVHDAPTEVVLGPLGARTGTRALRLVDAEGTAYWLEYRSPTGRDAWLGRPAENRYRLEPGVLLRRAASFPDTSVLLDGTPSAAAGWDTDLQAALPVGVPLALSGGDFTVTVTSLADGGAALSVVPTAPVPAGSAAPQSPRDPGTGRLLPGTRAGSGRDATVAGTAEALDAAGTEQPPAALPWTPPAGDVVAAGASLEPAAGSLPTGGLLLAVAGAALAGATTLVVRRARRLRGR
ncbi:reprolysin-like metallopeptidase [Blastococcus sp. SYSU D01042]